MGPPWAVVWKVCPIGIQVCNQFEWLNGVSILLSVCFVEACSCSLNISSVSSRSSATIAKW